jgi:hypothetical protein
MSFQKVSSQLLRRSGSFQSRSFSSSEIRSLDVKKLGVVGAGQMVTAPSLLCRAHKLTG